MRSGVVLVVLCYLSDNVGPTALNPRGAAQVSGESRQFPAVRGARAATQPSRKNDHLLSTGVGGKRGGWTEPEHSAERARAFAFLGVQMNLCHTSKGAPANGGPTGANGANGAWTGDHRDPQTNRTSAHQRAPTGRIVPRITASCRVQGLES